jgi:hypothetical protein
MHRTTIRFALFLLMSVPTIAASAAAPEVTFGPSGVDVRGVKPGTRVAWIAVIREWQGHVLGTHTLRGIGPARPNATFAIDRPGVDRSQSLWVIADVDAGVGLKARAPETVTSNHAFAVTARPGDATVVIESSAVEVLYVRRGAAWAFHVSDGGGSDADGEQNGSIAMRLDSLKPFKGNPHPPKTVQAGDLILVIDPLGVRTAVTEVKP